MLVELTEEEVTFVKKVLTNVMNLESICGQYVSAKDSSMSKSLLNKLQTTEGEQDV